MTRFPLISLRYLLSKALPLPKKPFPKITCNRFRQLLL
jgi:hypothetical protein